MNSKVVLAFETLTVRIAGGAKRIRNWRQHSSGNHVITACMITACATKPHTQRGVVCVCMVGRLCDPMRSLRQVLFRLSTCNTTSASLSTSIEDSHSSQSRNQSTNLLQSPVNESKGTPTALMSFHPRTIPSSSYLQSCFDFTLIEYSKVTGIDLITYPIATALGNCDCVETVITAIQEHGRSNDPSIDCSVVEPISQLKSTVQTVFWLAPNDALRDNIDLVGH
jgi:hypothetical protein